MFSCDYLGWDECVTKGLAEAGQCQWRGCKDNGSPKARAIGTFPLESPEAEHMNSAWELELENGLRDGRHKSSLLEETVEISRGTDEPEPERDSMAAWLGRTLA